MTMKLAFIMPTDVQRQNIGMMRESIVEMRPDQIKHFEHLLRSWGVFGRTGVEATVWRAIKRTLRDRP
jgi:hypothetical protein